MPGQARLAASLLAVMLVAGANASPAAAEQGTAQDVAAAAPHRLVEDGTMAAFLDRLMLVESGGRDTAKNPRSTALGAFQFLETTFLDVARRHFQAETGHLPTAQVLALRTNREFARRAAERFTRDNILHLAGHGIAPTFANLRLAYLVGPAGTVRLFKAEATAPVIGVLGAPVVQANPFMAGMTARNLVDWADRNMGGRSGVVMAAAPGSPEAALASRDAGPAAGAAAVQGAPVLLVKADATPPKPARPKIDVQCNLALASCRRWLALAERKAMRGVTTARAAGPSRRAVR